MTSKLYLLYVPKSTLKNKQTNQMANNFCNGCRSVESDSEYIHCSLSILLYSFDGSSSILKYCNDI